MESIKKDLNIKKHKKIYLQSKYRKKYLTYYRYFSRLLLQSESDKEVPILVGDM